MVYDEELAARVREILADRLDVREQKMFGGIAFMLRGNMCCGVHTEELILRVGPDQHEGALSQPHVRPMDFTGRPMRGFVVVDPGGYQEDKDLSRWIQQALEFVLTLPPK